MVTIEHNRVREIQRIDDGTVFSFSSFNITHENTQDRRKSYFVTLAEIYSRALVAAPKHPSISSEPIYAVFLLMSFLILL